MATFCSNCGAPLATSTSFCGNCGNRAGSPPNPAQEPAPGYAAPAAKGSSSALKIVLVLVCVLAVVGVTVVGGLWYAAHRIKQAVIQKAEENGVDLRSLGNQTSHTNAAARKLPRPCELLTKEQVSELIGEPIERAETQDSGCMYYGPAGLSAKLAQEKASGAFKHAQAPGSTVDAGEAATAVDQLVNNMAAQAGQTGSGGDMPLLMLIVGADGKSQMTALMASRAIFSGIGKSANGTISMGADVPGLGDKAMVMPKLGLNVLQGENLLRIISGPFPDADAKAIAVARAVLPKI